MKRNPSNLTKRAYDLLVVGAGIHGACVARDAAMRGMRVALIDRADFGGATSHNSLKIVHGGLRYLQHGDFRRMRQSVVERRFWLSAAPHLVRPLKFVMPTYGHLLRGPEALWAGMKVHDLVGMDRNKGVPPDRRLPSGRVISKDECARLIPGIDQTGLTGAAVWYDGQMVESDRAVLACVEDAVRAGADVANYVSAEAIDLRGARVEGVRARDLLNQSEFDIRASVTVNTCGPWAGSLLRRSGRRISVGRMPALARGMNLVTRRLFDDYAVGIMSGRSPDALVPRGGRLFFITPWRNWSVIGTSHLPYRDDPDHFDFTEEDIELLIGEVNNAYPPADLKREDVHYCYAGLTPAAEGLGCDEVRRGRRHEIIDHQRADGLTGLISVIGVKYTTARLVAEQVVDGVCRKLPGRFEECRTAVSPLPGGEIPDGFEELVSEACRSRPRVATRGLDSGGLVGEGWSAAAVRYLVENYGTEYRRVVGAGETAETVHQTRVAKCQCRYAVDQEMAVRLSDLVFRRTSLAASEEVTDEGLEWCAQMMASALGWSDQRQRAELDDVRGRLARHRRASGTVGQVL